MSSYHISLVLSDVTYKANGLYVLRISLSKMWIFMVLEGRVQDPWNWEVLDLGKVRLRAYN